MSGVQPRLLPNLVPIGGSSTRCVPDHGSVWCVHCEPIAKELRELRQAYITIVSYYAGLPVKYQSVLHKAALKLARRFKRIQYD